MYLQKEGYKLLLVRQYLEPTPAGTIELSHSETTVITTELFTLEKRVSYSLIHVLDLSE